MQRTDFFAVMQRQGWRVVDLVVYGVEEGYPLTADVAKQGKTCSVTITLGKAPDKALSKALKQQIKAVAKKCNFNDRHCSVTLWLDEHQEMPILGLSDVLRILREQGATPPVHCALCNGPEHDAYCVNRGGCYDAVHQACMDQLQSAAAEKAQQVTGSYLTGILGAILGCMVGIIPNILTIWFSETIYSLLYALIPLCTYYGYKLLRGKMTRVVVAITLVLSIISMFVIQFILLNLWMMDEYALAIGEALSMTLPLLGDSEVWGIMAQEAVGAFMVIVMGILIVWGMISRTQASDLKDVTRLRRTMLLKQGEGAVLPPEQDPFFSDPTQISPEQ